MPANPPEYDRNYRSLRKNESKEVFHALLKINDNLQNLRKEVAFLAQEIENLRKDSPPLIPPNGSLDSPLPPYNPPNLRRRGARLPDEWSLSEANYEFADKLGLEVEEVFDGFCDYWRAKAGKDGAKLDWSATWRNWCRKEASNKKVRKTNGHAPPGSTPEHRPAYAALRDPTEIMAEIRAKDRAKGVSR